MEKLEFKNYGLEELSHKELRETEGGFLASFLFGVAVGWLVTIIVQAIVEAG